MPNDILPHRKADRNSLTLAEAVVERMNVLLKEKSIMRYALEKKTGLSRGNAEKHY